MKRHLAALMLGLSLLTTSAHGITLMADGAQLADAPIYENTTFAPLRAVAGALCPDAAVSWEDGRAVVRGEGFTLTATPGDSYLIYNGERVALTYPVRLEEGRTLVPVRPLAALLEAKVTWSPDVGAVFLTTGRTSVTYSEDDLYWLSRIISAESMGEPWEGQVAVGNVVLNRVKSPDFPDTIHDVIFDDRWGGQFEPVRNGSIYNEPTEDSVLAAIACLEGASTVGDSLFFLAPALTDNHWTMENRDYVATIGTHWFYE